MKQEVFRQLDAVAKPGAMLATNTSTLDVDAIAAATARPENVVGLHFFSPANVMRLLEIVRGARTSRRTWSVRPSAWRKTLRKIAVVAGNADGFIGNRILGAYGTRGRLPARGRRHALADRSRAGRVRLSHGPVRHARHGRAGRDLAHPPAAERDPHQEPARYSPIADRICEMGRFGQKTGRGYYLYQGQGREATPDPEIESLIATVSAELGVERRPIADEDILRRLLCAMVNEGARILEEGVAQRAGDIDVVYVHGYGFPAYRGGPMQWAQEVGLAGIHESVAGFHRQQGERWKPARLLEQVAVSGGGWDGVSAPG